MSNMRPLRESCIFIEPDWTERPWLHIEEVNQKQWNRDMDKKSRMYCEGCCWWRVIPVIWKTWAIRYHFRHKWLCYWISKFHEDCVGAVEKNRKIMSSGKCINLCWEIQKNTAQTSLLRPDISAKNESGEKIYVEIDFRHETRYQKDGCPTYTISVLCIFEEYKSVVSQGKWDSHISEWLSERIFSLDAILVEPEEIVGEDENYSGPIDSQIEPGASLPQKIEPSPAHIRAPWENSIIHSPSRKPFRSYSWYSEHVSKDENPLLLSIGMSYNRGNFIRCHLWSIRNCERKESFGIFWTWKALCNYYNAEHYFLDRDEANEWYENAEIAEWEIKFTQVWFSEVDKFIDFTEKFTYMENGNIIEWTLLKQKQSR